MNLDLALSGLGNGPLDEGLIRAHIAPLFSRVLARQEIYLANHSLGRPLDHMVDSVASALDAWYGTMDEAWGRNGWMGALAEYRRCISDLIGLDDPRGVVPKTSAGQGLRAVLNAFPQDRPVRVVATRGEFDSLDFILKAYGDAGRAEVTWVDARGLDGTVPIYDGADVAAAITPGCDLVVVSQVIFSTGQVLPNLTQVVQSAHQVGAKVLLDTYHSAGVFPFSVRDLDVDFAVGGCYKYLRGGPGACWLAIHPRHQETMRTLDTGWFAKRDVFSYHRAEPTEPPFAVRATGGDGWLESTPPILTYYQALPGLRFTLALGVNRIRAYSLQQLTDLRQHFKAAGIPHHAPADPAAWGGYALVPHADTSGLVQRLKAHGVNTDARGGHVRFGPDLLNTSDELARAVEVLKAQF
jgi:kynureninase